jgi:hypothetical protein
MAAVAERSHADILPDPPLAPDPVSVTMPLSVDPVQRPGSVGTAMARSKNLRIDHLDAKRPSRGVRWCRCSGWHEFSHSAGCRLFRLCGCLGDDPGQSVSAIAIFETGSPIRQCLGKPTASITRSLPLFQFGESIAGDPDQLGYLAPASYGFCGVMTVPEGVLVADWGAASSRAAMHSTPAPSAHHWGPARLPAPGPGSTLGCAVHG